MNKRTEQYYSGDNAEDKGNKEFQAFTDIFGKMIYRFDQIKIKTQNNGNGSRAYARYGFCYSECQSVTKIPDDCKHGLL